MRVINGHTYMIHTYRQDISEEILINRYYNANCDSHSTQWKSTSKDPIHRLNHGITATVPTIMIIIAVVSCVILSMQNHWMSVSTFKWRMIRLCAYLVLTCFDLQRNMYVNS